MTTITQDNIDFVLNALKPGIIGFFNEVDKKVLVVHRKLIIDGITTFLNELNDGSCRYKKLEQDFKDNKITIRILETFNNDISDNDLRLAQSKFIDLYCKDYKLYNKRKALVYRLRKFVDSDTGLIHIQLVNRANKKITVGVFTNFEHSEKFVSEFYSDKNIYKVVYSSSIESLQYRFKELE